jgi:hypothetical protein
MELDTKTYWLTDWLTDRQSQCDFDFDLKGREAPFIEDLSPEAEDLAIVRSRYQVKTLRAEKELE